MLTCKSTSRGPESHEDSCGEVFCGGVACEGTAFEDAACGAAAWVGAACGDAACGVVACTGSVSYTHLDVYKRQAFMMRMAISPLLATRILCFCRGMVS